MYHFSKLITLDVQKVNRKTLMIENIPIGKRKTSFLIKYFKQKFPKVVINRITFVYDTRHLEYLKNQLLTSIEAKKFCFQYRLMYNQRCEVRPYCLGKFGGVFCCCGCCPKLDGVLYYAEEKAELTTEIKGEIKQVLAQPKGIAFVVFEKYSMAKELVFNEFFD